MSRHFYIISLAMMLMVFATGQDDLDTTWCGCDLRPEVAGFLDGSGGCFGGCAAGCIDCGDCGDCMACDDCADCGDCMGCDGCVLGKIPGTYSGSSSRDVVQVRLTSHAIDFFETMLRPKLGETLSPFPALNEEISRSVSIPLGPTLNIRVCNGATKTNNVHCDIEFNFKDIQLTAQPQPGTTPDRLRLALQIQAWTSHVNASGSRNRGWPAHLPHGENFLGVPNSTRDCTLDFDTRRGQQDHILVELVFSLGASGVAPRADINIIDVLAIGTSANTGRLTGISVADDVEIIDGSCKFTEDQLGDGALGTALANSIILEMRERLPRLIKGFLCEQRANLMPAGSCPAPSQSRNFASAAATLLPAIQGCGNPGQSENLRNHNCLPILLGMEGRLDLTGLVSALAPGFDAVVDFIVAAANGATTPNSGLSVWLKGGITPVSGVNDCVPALDPSEIPPVPNVPKAQIFQGNTRPSGQPAHVMVGVAEAFVNRAAYDLWNTGALCLQISSATLPMLDPALVGILFASDLKNLVFPASDSDSPLGVGLRPQKPPTIRFDNAEGGGVKVGVAMPELQLDFYAWSLDRYVRFVTFQLDIDIAVAVKANAGKIQLDLLGVDITNTRALNDSLISNGGSAANLITGVVGSLLPAFLGDSGPLFELDIAGILPETLELAGMEIPMPLSIELRDDALAAVYTNASGATIPARDENGHAFLGVFVDFAGGTGGGGSGLTAAVDTQVDITSVYIPEDKSAFAAETFGQGELPRVEFVMSASAPAGVPVEYRYRLGLGGWSEWQDSPYGVIEDPLLLLQQEHTIFARARVKGEPRTEDRSSAKARFSTDVTPPMVDITAEAKGIRIQAVDFHTRASELEYRFREPEGEFSEWAKLGPEATALIDASRDVEVEVRDAAGNVASNVAELRGLPPSSAAAGGCSCSAAGPVSGSSNSLLGFLAMVAMVGGMMYRLRRREEKV